MNDARMIKVKPNTHLLHFDQQSTKKLLTQLKISILDVQNIINKSKHSLGLISNSQQQLQHSPIENKADIESINFNVSGQSTIRDELTYSISPENTSRLKLQASETLNIDAPKKIFKKLEFSETQSRIQAVNQENNQNSIQKLRKSLEQIKISKQLQKQSAKKEQIKNDVKFNEMNEKTTNKKQRKTEKQLQQDWQLEIKEEEENQIKGLLAISKMDYSPSRVYKNYTETQQWEYNINIKPAIFEEKTKTQPKQAITENKIQTKYFSHQKLNIGAQQVTQRVSGVADSSSKWNTFLTQKKQSLILRKNNTLIPIKQQSQSINQAKASTNSTKAPSRFQRIKIFKQKVINFNNLHEKRAGVSISKSQKNIRHTQGSQASEMDNTCARNQLENILMLNYASRKTKQNKSIKTQQIVKTQNMFSSPNRKQNKKGSPQGKAHEKSNLQKSNKSKSVSPYRSPKKSNSKSVSKSKQKKSISIFHSPVQVKREKSPYIQKFINSIKKQGKVSPKKYETVSPKMQPKSTKRQEEQQLKYSHARKSPQNKKPLVFDIQKHLQTNQICNRDQFITKMLKQCYVRRFLNQQQLSKIYDELVGRKIPQYQWQQKVIERIFKKIHQYDQIM